MTPFLQKPWILYTYWL